MSAEAKVLEARDLARKLIEHERGRCGGHVEPALYRASAIWGVDEGALRSLWHRWRNLKGVQAHILDRLREIDAVLSATNKRRKDELLCTAETLEKAGHVSAALVARKAAGLVGEEE